MRLLSLIAIVFVTACATAKPETEVIAYNPGLTYAELMAGGVPIVDGSIYNGITTMPEVVLKNISTAEMSATKFEPFSPLAGSQQTDKYLQVVSVINLDTTGAICLYLETWAQTCASSVAFTCEGASLQGLVVPAGASRTFRFTGSNKVCANASENATDGQLERTIFYAR